MKPYIFDAVLFCVIFESSEKEHSRDPRMDETLPVSCIFKSNYGATHHILPGVLPRCDEDVVPGQGQQQSQGNHVEFKVPNDDDKELRSRERDKTFQPKKRASPQSASRLHTFRTCCWPLMSVTPENIKPTICAAENDAHSKRIDMQRHNYHGAGHKNKGEFKQRYRSAVSGPRFTTLTLKASSSHKPEEEDGEEDEPEPSEPLYSLPIIPSLRSCTVFSRGTSKLIHPYTSLKYEPLTSHTQSP